MPDLPEFQPTEILRVLADHRVRYVLIGGLAAVARGSPQATFDVDVTPLRTTENLERLSTALSALEARVWTPDVPDGLPFGHDADSIAAVAVWNLLTRYGRLDI